MTQDRDNRLSPSSRPNRARRARIAAIQAHFQADYADEILNFVAEEFIRHRFVDFEGGKPDKKFFRTLIDYILESQDQLPELVSVHLTENWTLEKLDPVTRSILFVATAESISGKTPPAILISEYVQITQGFTSDGESKFVNGVLSKIIEKLS